MMPSSMEVGLDICVLLVGSCYTESGPETCAWLLTSNYCFVQTPQFNASVHCVLRAWAHELVSSLTR